MQSILQYRRLGRAIHEQLDKAGSMHSNGGQEEKDSTGNPGDVDKEPGHDQSRGSEEHRGSTGSSTLAGRDESPSGNDLAYRVKGIEIGSKGKDKGDNNSVDQQEKGQKDQIFLVGFESDDDPLNPKNWPLRRKWTTMGIVATTGLLVGWASSIDSGAATQASKEFGVSDVTESLATCLYLVGFAFGAFIAAPFSETVGRNPVYLVSLLLFMIFVMASGLSPNIGAQLVFRLFAGFFGSTPLTTFGGSMSDMFNPLDRTYVFPVCGALSFLGPFLAPLVGAYIGQSDLISWRWCEWITLIMAGLVTVSIFLFVPETYAPVLQQWRAQHLRRLTGDERFLAENETSNESLFKKLLMSTTRPFELFFSEIMVALFTLYLVVVYIVLFGFLTGYDAIYGEIYHFSQGSVGLAFIGMNVGFLVALAIVPIIYRDYARKLRRSQEKGESKLEPEQRLWYAMLGAPCLPISLFWMGWTADGNISYWSSLVASVMFGFSVQAIFISTYQYLIDTYETFAATALVSATFMRYLAAGAMSTVSIPMYKNLGVHWSLTLLGCLGAVMAPIPYVFYCYGHQIREKFSSASKA